MDVGAKIYLDRRTDGKLQKVLVSKYSDLAETAAAAIAADLRCNVVVVYEQKGYPPKVFEWGQKTISGVVQTEAPDKKIEECDD